MNRNRMALAAVIGVATTSILFTGCTPTAPPSPEAAGEIVLTCTSCATSPTDDFQKYRSELTERFNQESAGKYRIEVLPTVGEGDQAAAEEGYRRLALAGDLPDLMVLPGGLSEELGRSVDLMDFAPHFQTDSAFTSTFHDGVLGIGDAGSHIVPEERSIAGVFYNTALLRAAGIEQPPVTWDELKAMAQAVKADGKIPLAVDGQWVTLLWLSHLIGTADGGAAYLNDLLRNGVGEAAFADNPLWTQAVEYLRDLHTASYVNEDAFTGDFQRANAPFGTGDAAAIANGPWQVDITEDQKVVESMVSVPAPGDGIVIFSGGGGWASAATSPEKQEAVWAFIRFAYSPQEQALRTIGTNSYPAVQVEFSDDQRSKLSSINVSLVEQSTDVENTYPALALILPTAFQDAWRNHWPAYVQGAEDTTKFLNELSSASVK